MGCKSVAFPLLAAGNNGFDKDLAFEIAVRSFRDFESSILQKIILVIYGEKVAALVKEKGYSYEIKVPRHLAHDKKALHEQQEEHAQFKRELFRQAGEAVHAAFDSAKEFLKDPEIQKKLFEKAMEIVGDATKKDKKEEA